MSINIVRELLVPHPRRAVEDVLECRSSGQSELQVNALDGANRRTETVPDERDVRDGVRRKDGFYGCENRGRTRCLGGGKST